MTNQIAIRETVRLNGVYEVILIAASIRDNKPLPPVSFDIYPGDDTITIIDEAILANGGDSFLGLHVRAVAFDIVEDSHYLH